MRNSTNALQQFFSEVTWALWNSVYSETPPTTSRRKVIVHKCQITSYLRLYDCINVFLRYRNRIFILSPTYIFTPSLLKKPLNYHIVAFHSKTKTFMFLFLNDIYVQQEQPYLATRLKRRNAYLLHLKRYGMKVSSTFEALKLPSTLICVD